MTYSLWLSVLATSREEVVRALRFVRQHGCRPIDVMDVVEYVRVPRTTPQVHLKKVTGRTIHQEIRRIQIARAKEQLSTASAPIKQVAGDCGFKNVQYFTWAFHHATGETPARFQRRHLSERTSI